MPQPRKPTPKELFIIGKEVNFALPVFASSMRPSKEHLKVAAEKLGISASLAAKALSHYIYN